MTPPRRFRFSQHRAAAALPADRAPRRDLTREDQGNLETYARRIGETVTLLRSEVAGIQEGNLEVVGSLYEEKAAALKWIELQTPVVEPFLDSEAARRLNLRGLLADFQKAIEEDSAYLSRMAVAARTILREVEKISSRNSLGGSYGKSGKKLDQTGKNNTGIDREF